MHIHTRASTLALVALGWAHIGAGEDLHGTAQIGLGWEGVAAPTQVVGALPSGNQPYRAVALSINRPRDEATLVIGPHVEGITDLALRCGIAGSDGAILWQPRAGAAALNNRIVSADVALGAGMCGVTINNVASLEAAARERRLYVDMRINGVAVRGQLWPKIDLRDSNVAWITNRQVVAAGPGPFSYHFSMRFELDPDIPTFTISQSPLESLQYALSPYEPPRALGLYCGRAGENGELVAHLLDSRGVLTGRDVVPAHASGACGMDVNNVASLLEAMLSGRFYVAGTLAEGTPLELRGQYLPSRGMEAVASPAQVVGGAASPEAPSIPVAFWVNDPKDSATVYVQEAHVGKIDSLVLRCGLAGSNGPIVWRSPPFDASFPRQLFRSEDIEVVDDDRACGAPIRNLASLSAAAKERRIYVEIEKGGNQLRGQVWPRLETKPLAWMSDQQVVGAASISPRWLRSFVALSFSELSPAERTSEGARPIPGPLTSFGYHAAPFLPFASLALRCARAGEDGPVIATLSPDPLSGNGRHGK